MKYCNLRRINPTEHEIQCAIVEWAKYARLCPLPDHKNMYVSPGEYLIAVPNGGYRNKLEAKRLKKEGVTCGVSDLFLAIRCKRKDSDSFYGGLWIEIKSKKGKLSKSQKEWIETMNTAGYSTAVVNTVEAGIKAIKDYLGIK